MSKIGKKPIQIPNGVEAKFDSGLLSLKGPKGSLQKNIPSFLDLVINGEISIKPKNDSQNSKEVMALWGLTRALVNNMIKGITEGFEKVLEFQGVGYKAVTKGDELELGLGYSHPVKVKAPQGIEFKVEKNTIRISGIDKDLVGKVAADIRTKREPEPYKGSGIRYQGEIIKRKAGKKAVAAG